MRSLARILTLLVAATVLCGCNMVVTDKPMFNQRDSVGAPTIRAGVWRAEIAGCEVDETAPQDQWPKCAEAEPGVGDPPAWLEVAGDPDLLQMPAPMPSEDGMRTVFVYLAFRPLKLDAEGRVVVMKSWSVQCGPPGDSGGKAPDAPDAGRPPLGASAADEAKFQADLAKLPSADTRFSGLRKLNPTSAPLPGLTMNKMGGCTPASVEALRAAAKASEAWAPDHPVTHWVRARRDGDKPPASAAALGVSGAGGGVQE